VTDDDKSSSLMAAGEALVDRVLALGVDGVGPLGSAVAVADDELVRSADVELAIHRLLTVHRRLVGATGFITSVGGATALAIGLPADVTSFYAVAARLSFAIAHLRGYDVTEEPVRTLVLVSLLGSHGDQVLARAGVDATYAGLLGRLRQLPAERLLPLQRAVGHRLVTTFGRKSAINLVKLVPIVGGGVGAGVNVVELSTVARHAMLNFPPHPHGRYDGEGVTVIEG